MHHISAFESNLKIFKDLRIQRLKTSVEVNKIKKISQRIRREDRDSIHFLHGEQNFILKLNF